MGATFPALHHNLVTRGTHAGNLEVLWASHPYAEGMRGEMKSPQATTATPVAERQPSPWRMFRCTECGAVLGPAIQTGPAATLVRRCPICRTPHREKAGGDR
jgi:hypothetical protein